jgi:hypothetical protein
LSIHVSCDYELLVSTLTFYGQDFSVSQNAMRGMGVGVENILFLAEYGDCNMASKFICNSTVELFYVFSFHSCMPYSLSQRCSDYGINNSAISLNQETNRHITFLLMIDFL